MSTKVAGIDKSLFFCRTADFLDVFLVNQCNRSIRTRESYRDGLTAFKDYVIYSGKGIMNFLYTDCTYEFVLGFKEYLADVRGYKPSSINQRVAALKSYLRYSSSRDTTLIQIYISISNVPKTMEPKVQRPVLDENAVGSLLAQPPATPKGLRDTLIMALLFDTAIRLDELVSLQMGDIYRRDDLVFILVHGGNSGKTARIFRKAA